MHAVGLLRSCLRDVLDRMHGRRCAALLGAVRALIAGRRLTLMDLARSWPDALRVAGPLKKLDRLLGNVHLAGERDALYAAIVGWVVRQPRPVIVVDWSPLDRRGRFQLLRAGLAVGGPKPGSEYRFPGLLRFPSSGQMPLATDRQVTHGFSPAPARWR
jgi:hypothetical protein